MIDMTVSVAFSIVNLTEFNWADLQNDAQAILDDYVLHTIPTSVSIKDRHIVTRGDQDLSVFVTRRDNCIEFLFVQPSLLDGKQEA